MKAEEFLLYGNQQLDASLGANSATASDKRRMCVSLPRLKMDIYAYFPTALVSVKNISMKNTNEIREQLLVRDTLTGQRSCEFTNQIITYTSSSYITQTRKA